MDNHYVVSVVDIAPGAGNNHPYAVVLRMVGTVVVDLVALADIAEPDTRAVDIVVIGVY